jgi:uncharacterized membrane protein
MQQAAPSQRLYELDAAKFVAMLLMIVGHALDALVRPDELDITRLPWSLWHWWRGITAPIFLTISGMLFALTLRRDDRGRVERSILRRRILRAVQVGAIGYLLVLPAHRLYDLPFVENEVWRAFFQVNILQLVAASLTILVIFAAVFNDERVFRRAVLLGSIAIAALTPLVHRIAWYDHLPSALAAYVSYDGGSLFPVFPFSAFMLFGAWLGARLRTIEYERLRWFRRTGIVLGGMLAVVGVTISTAVPIAGVDIYRYTPIGVAIREGVALLFIVGVSLALPALRAIERLLVLFGKQALTIYVLHLVLLFGSPWFSSIGRLYPKALSLGEGIAAAITILVLTLGSVVAWQHVRPYILRPAVVQALRIGVAVVLAYLLLA